MNGVINIGAIDADDADVAVACFTIFCAILQFVVESNIVLVLSGFITYSGSCR